MSITRIKQFSILDPQNCLFVVFIAILYFYLTEIFRPFEIYSITFFTFDQVEVLVGIALACAFFAFYGPIQGILSVIIGECLVQWKIAINSMWWLPVVYSLFFIPLFFMKFESVLTRLTKFTLKLSIFAILGALFGTLGFFLSGLITGISIEQIAPQTLAFAISCVVSFLPITIALGVLFAKIRQPRTIYSQVLTHHIWEEKDHTIVIRFGGLTIHFCTRCTGMVVGVVFFLILMDLLPISLEPSLALLFCIILPAPGLLIWSGQKFGLWKDKTSSRLVNGSLLGASIYMLTQTRPLIIEMTIILVIYFVVFYLVMFFGTRYENKKFMDEERAFLEKFLEEKKDRKSNSNETLQNP